ncbi:type II secretion system major pseudopilin GspG [Planctomycetota bacterium]
MRNRRRSKRRNGFTLLEVLLVLMILVILASMTTLFIRGAGQKAKRRAAEAQIGAFGQALDMYEMDYGSFPGPSEGLQALRTPPQGGAPIVNKEIPLDPWGSPYQYEFVGDTYRIWSLGPDKNPGTEDDVG